MNEKMMELLKIFRHLEASGRVLPKDMADKKAELEKSLKNK